MAIKGSYNAGKGWKKEGQDSDHNDPLDQLHRFWSVTIWFHGRAQVPVGKRGEGLDEPGYNERMANCLPYLLLVQVALSCYSWITSYLRTQDDPGPEISPNEALRALQTASQCHQRPVDADVGETRILQRLERSFQMKARPGLQGSRDNWLMSQWFIDPTNTTILRTWSLEERA